MTENLPFLPIGLTNFENLRQKNFVYVDKTKYFTDLLKEGKFIFCARPRRFGKSLTIRTLDDFFSGKIDLFRGLAVENYMNSPDFFARPVIWLDMSLAAAGTGTDILLKKIKVVLEINAERHNVSLRGDDFTTNFFYLLKDVHHSFGKKVILLIDEYDSPVINVIGKTKDFFNSELLSERRAVMQDFYSVIKSAEKEIELAFITGITKFSRISVFSQLNNLIDISLSSKYSSFMGYTQEELVEYFLPFMTVTADKLEISLENILENLKDRYNGFSFDGKQLLYNPFSMLSFFHDEKFSN
ncbi:MAG: AAA family ATPase, partial [Deltaproteobacteria bacterium]|nr:AAA family ATPase [Deltaproteobacteria bacterium]